MMKCAWPAGLLIVLTACISTHAVCAEDDVSLVRAVRDTQIPVDERLQSLLVFESKLSPASAKLLIEFIPQAEPELLPGLAAILAENQQREAAVEALCAHLLTCSKAPARAVAVLQSVYESVPDNITYRPMWRRAALAFADMLDAAGDADCAAVLSTAQMFIAEKFFPRAPDRYARAVLTRLKSRVPAVRGLAALWLDSGLAALLRETEIAGLIETLGQDEHLSDKLTHVLGKVTHFRATATEAAGQVAEFKAWWKKNVQTFRVIDAALAVVQDQTRELAERRFAVNQVSHFDTLPPDQLAKVIQVLMRLAEDKAQPLHVRADALLNLVQSPVVYEQAKPLLVRLTDDPQLYRNALSLLCIHESPDVLALLKTFLAEPATRHELKCFAAECASETAKAKEFAPAIMDFFNQEAAAGRIKQDEPAPRALMRAIEKLEGGKEIDWNKRLNAAPAPVPAPVIDAASKVTPVELQSRRAYNFKTGMTRPHQLTLTLDLTPPAGQHVVSMDGYALLDVVTDTGERLRSDWQRTILLGHQIHQWKSTRAPFSEPQQPKAERLTIQLGSPLNAVKTLPVINGYFTLRCADDTSRFNVPRSQWNGQPLDVPHLRELGTSVSVEGKTITLKMLNENRKTGVLYRVIVVDVDGKELDWTLASESAERGKRAAPDKAREPGVLVYRLETTGLPANAVIAFELFNSLREERVPFQLKNIPLENVPVKPPEAPDF